MVLEVLARGAQLCLSTAQFAIKGQSSLANKSQMNETFEGALNYLK